MKRQADHPLLSLAKAWLDPNYPLRQKAVCLAAPEYRLSPASFAWALDWIFSLWTPAQIEKSIAQNPYLQSRFAVQVLASTTPAMIAQGFFQGAILGIPQGLKIPSQQPSFARLLKQSFLELATATAKQFELYDSSSQLPLFYKRLEQADLVFLYGEDKTIENLKAHLAPNTLIVAHGHAESAAVIFKEAANQFFLEKLALDFLSYDQRGCLSPRVVFIEKGGELSPAECAALFSEIILPPLADRYPRGGLFPGEAAEILHQRSVYGFRGRVYPGKDWTVCFDETPDWPQVHLPRFLPFKSFESSAQLKELLNPARNYLLSLGCAGSTASLNELALNPSLRLNPLGEMQKQLLIPSTQR